MSSDGSPSSGFTLWLTGLPCSGKTTLALRIVNRLKAQGKQVELLDGDEIRKWFSQDLDYSRKDRDLQVQRIGRLAHLLTRNGIIAVVAAVAAYREPREANRKLIQRFAEVFVRCPLEVCLQRDSKGMYREALDGKRLAFTGIDASYEEPEHPEIIVDTHVNSENDCVEKILQRLAELGVVSDVLTTPAEKPT